MAWFSKKKIPQTDVRGRPFDQMTDSEIEASVESSSATKKNRKRQIEDELEDASLPDEDRIALEDELHSIEMYFWLLRGGDRNGEPPPARRD